MKASLILGFTLLFGLSVRELEGQANPESESAISYPDHFDQVWVMSSGWHGYMGVAIAISGERYFYWMYSDITVEANYPYTGSFRIEDDVLILGSPSEYGTGISVEAHEKIGLYSDRWRILPGRLSVALHSAKDDVNDVARTLIPDFQFDPHRPFRNQYNLQAESGQPAVRSVSMSAGRDKAQTDVEERSQ